MRKGENLVVKMYGRMKVLLHAFLTLALAGGEWSASCPGHFTPKEGRQYQLHRVAGCVPDLVWSEKDLLLVPGMEV
jgi:hypothetical protein